MEKMLDKLEGENRVGKFKQAAENLVSRMASCEGVVGIIFLGALVRDYADKFSDVDITVLLADRDEELRMRIRKMGLSEEKCSGIEDIDLMIYFLEDFRNLVWSETERWDYSKAAKIVYDPRGEVERIFREKLTVPKDFWVRRIVVCANYLKWYCCPPDEPWVQKLGVGSISETWIYRGDLIAAHYCLNYGVDLILEILFALNREFLPVPKWRIFYSYRLVWLPEDYSGLLREVMQAKNFSEEELNRRLKAIRELWVKILGKIRDETGLTPEQISKYYVTNILEQT